MTVPPGTPVAPPLRRAAETLHHQILGHDGGHRPATDTIGDEPRARSFSSADRSASQPHAQEPAVTRAVRRPAAAALPGGHAGATGGGVLQPRHPDIARRQTDRALRFLPRRPVGPTVLSPASRLGPVPGPGGGRTP